MKTDTPRARIVLPCLLTVVLGFAGPLGSMSSAPLVEPLAFNEIALLEELADWVGAEEPPEDLPRVIRSRLTSFEVFRSFHGPEVRHGRLDQDVPYGDSIRRVAEKHGLDGLLLAAVIEAESSFDPRATSSRGAVGLMQVLPSTAGESPEKLYEPDLNLEVGALYLKAMLERFGGDLELALAAYNAGPANVRRYGGVPPFRETRSYVRKVLDRYVEHHREVWQTTESSELLTG